MPAGIVYSVPHPDILWAYRFLKFKAWEVSVRKYSMLDVFWEAYCLVFEAFVENLFSFCMKHLWKNRTFF